MTPAEAEIRHALADPAASNWLRQTLETALDRDPVDAANDAAFLARVLHARALDAVMIAAPEICGRVDHGHICRMPKGTRCPDCGPALIDFGPD